MRNRTSITKYIIVFLFLFLSYIPVYAQTTSTSQLASIGNTIYSLQSILDNLVSSVFNLTKGGALQQASVLPSSGLISHWNLDDGAGVSASDSSGVNNGTLVNGPTWVTGKDNKAVRFDGIDDYIDLGTMDVSGSGFTISAWFNADNFNVSDGRIVSKATGQNEQDHYWMLSTIDSGGPKLRFRLKTAGNTSTLIGTQTIAPGSWVYAVATYDGTTMRLYTNGVETGSMSKSGVLDTNSNVGVRIGDNPGADRKRFSGIIDDVAIYNRALTATEVADLYNGATSSGTTTPPPTTTPAPTASITSANTSITSGGSTTLTWTSTNAASCSGTNFTTNNSTSGSVNVSPTQTTTYSLSCTGSGGSANSSVTVTVTAPPTNTTPPTTTTGTGAIDNLQPGYWYEVPNSRLDSVAPTPLPAGTVGVRGVMDAWNGGAYDSIGDRLIVWGGGHSDYSGNELYAFSISNGSWSILEPPTPNASVVESSPYYADGKPSSRHTYNTLQFLPKQNMFISCAAAALWGPTGYLGDGKYCDAYDLQSNRWLSKGSIPSIPTANAVLSTVTAVHPTTGNLWVLPSFNSPLQEYNPATKTWNQYSVGPFMEYYATGAIDPNNNIFVVVGNNQFYVWDLNNPNAYPATPSTSGPTDVVSSQAPGFEYDPVSKKFVAWIGGTSVYTLDPNTWTWTRVSASSGNSVSPTTPEQRGTYGRFRYIPSKNAFIVVNRTNENVYYYKLTSGSGTTTPPPTTTPAPTASITSANTSITSGGSTTLTWTSTNAASCSGTNFTTNNSTSGSVNVSPTQTTTYSLSCTGSGGSANSSVTVTVTAPPTNTTPPVISLTSSATNINNGGNVTLTWSASNADSCTASGSWSGIKSASGSQTFTNLTSNQTYNLSCSGSGGTDSKTVLVSVQQQANIPPPVITNNSIVSFKVTNNSSTNSVDVPVTFGQVFKKGDVPAGASLVAKMSNGTAVPIQVDKKAKHRDGSLRHAILTVRIPSISARSTESINLFVTSSVTQSTSIKISDVLASGYDATVELVVNGVRYTASARELLQSGNPKVWLSGPEVSEWIIGGPVKDANGTQHPHLAAYFYIRAYADGRVRTDVVVENGWLLVPGPKSFTPTATIKIGGNTVYGPTTLSMPHHTRWHQVKWWSPFGTADPNLSVSHDTQYLRDTGAVPNYIRNLKPSESALNSLNQINIPMSNGQHTNDMGSAGYQPAIGILPLWDSLYVVSGDSRAFNSVLANASGGGAYSMHYRDESTGKPVAFSMHPTLTEQDNSLPATSGGNPLRHEFNHQPSIGYLAYLISGDYYYLEELQFWAGWNYLWTTTNPSYGRQGSKGIFGSEVRGQAWALRTLGQAAYITPDSDPLKNEYVSSLRSNLIEIENKYAKNPNANNLGGIQSYDGYTQFKPWMDDFYTMTAGYLVDLGFDEAVTVRNWKAKNPLGRMGTSEYCYSKAAAYVITVGTDNSTWYPNFSSLFQNNFGANTSCPEGLLMDGYSNLPTGFVANLRPSLAVAVDAGLTGAVDAWNRMMNSQVQPDYNDIPIWGISPRVLEGNSSSVGSTTGGNTTGTTPTAQVPDTASPTQPTNLSGTALSDSRISLTWNMSTDNRSVTGYNIYRNGVLVNTTSNNSYTDTGLTASTRYSYKVSAVDAAGNESSTSNTLSIVTGDVVTPSTSTKFSIGDNIIVNTPGSVLNVRQTANGVLVGTQQDNTIGLVTGGPVSSGNLIWWNIDFSGGVDGWVAGDFIESYTVPAVPVDFITHYKFDEGAGTSVIDSSGNNNGTIVNGATWTNGKIGGGLYFDGVNDYVDAGTFDVSGNEMTISAWFKANNFSVSDARIISKATGQNEQDHYWMISTIDSGGTKLRFRLKTGGNTSTLISSQTISPGVWVHVVGTYDGATMRIYTNGVETGSIPKSGLLDTNNTVGIRIGDNPGAFRRNFNGVIDDIRIYNRALSPSEISLIYNNSSSGSTNTSTPSGNTQTPDTPATSQPSLDITAPVISTPVVTITTNGAIVSFTTNESTVAYIDYGLTTSYTSKTELNTGTRHTFILSNLSDGTKYNYVITATDNAGNKTQTTNNTFTTKKSIVPDTIPPAKITDLSASNVTQTSVDLVWTAPGDDGDKGNASSYDIRYSESPLTELNWANATVTTGEPTPSPAGSSEELFISVGLSPDTMYYFGVKTTDEAGNISLLSNVVSVTTLDTETAPTPKPAPAKTKTSTGGGGGGSSISARSSGGGGGGGFFVDITPPAQAKNTKVESADRQIAIKWDNPSDIDYVRTVIVRKEDSAPLSRLDGEKVYEGTDKEFIDTNLDNNKTYYYAIYTLDRKPNYSKPVIITSKPTAGRKNIETVSKDKSEPKRQSGKATIRLPKLSGPFSIGMESEQVKVLQQYLAQDKDVYPEGIVSGYYGNLTRKAVERFQKKYGIVSSGTPGTTGYGLAGPSTRAKIQEVIGSQTSKTIAVSQDSSKEELMQNIRKQIEELQALVVKLLSQLADILQKQAQNI